MTVAGSNGESRRTPLSLPDAIDVIRPSVVQIHLQNDLNHTLGTGFFVDERATVVTALHVLDAGAARANHLGRMPPKFVACLATPNVLTTSEGTFRLEGFSHFDAEPLGVSLDDDLAALRLKENPFAGQIPPTPDLGDGPILPLFGVAKLDVERPRDGATVAVSGYPLLSNVLVTNSGCVASAWGWGIDDPMPEPSPPPADQGDEVHELTIMQGPLPERYLADLEVNGGNSGGPVYLQETAGVIGVCVATRSAYVMYADQQGGAVMTPRGPIVYSSGLTGGSASAQSTSASVTRRANIVCSFLSRSPCATDDGNAGSGRSTPA
jgi:S1-C subfamily serine protease